MNIASAPSANMSSVGKKAQSARSDAPKGGRGDGASAARAVNRTELSTIDFSGDASIALADCAGMVRVHEVGPGIGATYEEAAVLYANGDLREAESLLDGALSDDGGAAGEGLWMMLLDLYRLTGQRERFESRVLDYATRFERSPPPWNDLSKKPMRARSEVVPLINLAGNLSSAATEQFRQMLVIGQKSGAIRIDLKRVRSFENEGCGLLLDAIKKLGRERAKVSLMNAAGLVEMLAGKVRPGEADDRESWLLLLELLQHTGEFERFEDVALDYAITFEESPPSWENVEPAAVTEATSAAEEVRHSDATFVLEGDVTHAGAEVLRKLAAFASERSSVEVECGLLRRMDFVSAGTLFNILSTLRAQGKLVCLQNVNAMVAALLRVMGIDQVAQVMLRG